LASRNYKTGVIITGDADGAVKAVNLTKEQLELLNDVQQKTASGSASMAASLRGAADTLGSVAKVAAGAALAIGSIAAAALVKLTKEGLVSADALAKQSDKLGIATEKIAAYSLAAKDTGVSQDLVFKAIQRTSKVLVDAASGSDSAQRSLAALGLEASSLLKLSPDKQFEKIADALNAVDNQSVKTALAMKIFGKSGAEALNFIALGSAGLAEFSKTAEITGQALTRDMAAKVEIANDAMERLGSLTEGLGQQLAVRFAPMLLEISDRLFGVAEEAGGMGRVAETVFNFIIDGAGKVATAADFIGVAFNTVTAIMREINAVAATTVQYLLEMGAHIVELYTIGPSEIAAQMRLAAQSFQKQAVDEMTKASAAWDAALKGVQEYGKSEAALKLIIDDVNKSANARAAAIARGSGATAAAKEGLDQFSDSVISSVEADLRATTALSTLNKELDKEREALEKAATAFNEANDPATKFKLRIAEIEALQKSGLVTQTAINNAVQAAVDAYAAATDAGAEFNKMQEEGKTLTEQLRTPTEQYADELERLNGLKSAGAITEETVTRGAAAAAQKLADANAAAAGASSKAWQDFGKSVSEAFRDTFLQADENLNDFLKRAGDALKEAASRWVFDSTIGRLFGGVAAGGVSGGAQAAGGAVGGGGGGGAGSLLGGNYGSLVTSGGVVAGANSALLSGASYISQGLYAAGYNQAANSFVTAYANTTRLGNSIYPGGGTVAGGLATAGAGIAGSYVGNILGESVFNKKAESSYGSATGSLAGAYIGAQYGSVGGPWGAAIGAVIGALADVAFGGDGKKRSNTGAIVGPTVEGGTVAASGLRIAPYDRRGSDDGTQKLTSALIQIDEVLTGVARSAGVNVDFSNTALKGRNPDAGHDGDGIFFGGKGFNGGAEGFAEAPEMFIRAWIDEINDQLPKRVRDIIKGVDGTAEELVTGFAAAVEIDNLLGLDVVKDTKSAVDKLLEPQKLLIDLYDSTTERVMSLAAGIDGSAAGLVTLSEALREQKTAAVELALAYQGVQLETGALFGGAIQSIRESLLSDEQLYEERRAQIAALTAELATTISPDEISRLQNEIVGLSTDTYRSLDSGQQEALGAEFIAFLTEAQSLAQQQLEAGIASLSSREDGIRATIDLELSAAQQQTQAASTMQSAADQFGQWVQELQNNPPALTINIPGYGNVTLPFGINQLSEITF